MSIISTSSDRRRMQRSSLESPCQAASNGGSFHPSMTTGRRDIQRNINNSAFNIYVTAPFTVSLNISASSSRRRMKLPPFDAT